MARTLRNLPDKIELPESWTNPKSMRAGMDLTKTTAENKRHWKDADSLSARAAYPKFERKRARERSRLEALNNSWYAGMLRTAANHIGGIGPRLQVMTTDTTFNARLERAWRKWSTEIRLAEKLRIIIESYWRDGEIFGMRARRPTKSGISLDIRLYECDQVTQPYQHINDPTTEDGIRVDNLGNAIEYWILDYHPGDIGIGRANFLKGDWYPAKDVFHLFRADRPGQIRGIPRCSPAIDWLAHMRRFSKATLSAAEAAALWAVFIKTPGTGLPASMPEDLMSLDFVRNALNFLPAEFEPVQLKPEHPATTNESFQRTELMYFCRCANMPYSLACGTSKDANFSAAKMDIKNLWEPEVKSEQETITQIVIATILGWFMEEAVFVTGLLDGAPAIDDIDCRFDWPPLPTADEYDVAKSVEIRVSTGQSTLRSEYMQKGQDFDAAMQTAAQDFGVTVEEYKRALFAKLIGPPAPTGTGPDGKPTEATTSAGAFVGTNRRDFTNNQKQTREVLEGFMDGASETFTKSSLMRLGWSEGDAISLIEDAKDGVIDSEEITEMDEVTP